MATQLEIQQLDLNKAEPLTARVSIGEKGRLVIPAAIREALVLNPGDVVDMYVENHELHLSTRWNRMARAQERARKFFEPGRSLADELTAERRTDVLKE